MTLDVTHHITDNIAINNISENDDGHNISAPNRIAGVIMMRKMLWRIPSYSGVYSLGADFHKLQLEAIEKLKINLTLSYAKDINMILHVFFMQYYTFDYYRYLSSIMYCGELKTKYIKYFEKTWNQVCSRVLIPKELPTVADLQLFLSDLFY
ncbi:hypothetical protein GLOIN_2v1880010 [Rhizophagus irregularis DAOM 181602=DAOM 197198]|nr:hypothetical protein GLOIN_2v1880010 [Rhizophagus irregularis DAOM 181602=DAOM 197198]